MTSFIYRGDGDKKCVARSDAECLRTDDAITIIGTQIDPLVIEVLGHRACGCDEVLRLVSGRPLKANVHALYRIADRIEIERGDGSARKTGSAGRDYLCDARRIAWRDELGQIKRRMLIRRQEALAVVRNIGRSRATIQRQWEQAGSYCPAGKLRALVQSP